MLGIFKRRGSDASVPKKRRRSRDDGPRGGLENFAAEDITPEDPDGIPEESGAMAAEAVPEAGSVPMDAELARQSRESRYEAERRMRADDQKRQTVFACACVVAGFCGITGVIFGTAAVCSRLGQPQQTVIAGSPNVVQGYANQDIWYDAGGQMHVNVHITREPDKEINIYIDQNGNVSTEPSEPADTAPGNGENGGQGSDEADADTDPNANADGEDGANEEPPVSEGPKTEADLLAEMEARKAAGGSGYLESDVQYLIVRGDTLSAISHRTGFSVDFLAAYNYIENKNLIIAGEILRYPSFTPAN